MAASPDSSPDFQILTSLRYDPMLVNAQAAEGSFKASHFYMLEAHRERMLEAIKHFNTFVKPAELENVASFEAYLESVTRAWQAETRTSEAQPLKLRVALSRTGGLATTLSPTEPVGESTLFPSSLSWAGRFNGVLNRMLLDDAPSALSSHSVFKTSQRATYDAARTRFGLRDYAEPVDVVLVSETGKVLESSISSIYFKRAGRWVTPPTAALSDGEKVDVGEACQMGTTRRWALKRGLAVEGSVDADSVRDRELVVTSNGVKGFCLGLIALSDAAKARARGRGQTIEKGKI